jgi:osmotically-inducible protein OsmY
MNKFFVILTLPLLLNGCTFLGVGTAELTGIALFHDRRDAQTIILDEKIENDAFLNLNANGDIWDNAHINVTAFNGIVLLTGECRTGALMPTINTIVQNLHNVRAVHNHILLTEPAPISSRNYDSLITTRVKTAFASDRRMPGFDTNRIKVVSENGRVFLMGLVHQKEAEIATEIARRQSGVQAVIKVFEYLY